MANGSDQCILGFAMVSTLGLSILCLIMSFHAPQYGAVLADDVGDDDFCDDLYISHVRPFRFALDNEGPFSCPWPTENTVFRGVLAVLGIGLVVVGWYNYYKEHLTRLWYLSYFFALAAAFWLSVATLDADSLRRGNALCEDKFKVSAAGQKYNILSSSAPLECQPGPFIWLVLLDFTAVVIFAGASYVWHRFSQDTTSKHLNALSDPFLTATQGPDPFSPGNDFGYEPVVSGISTNGTSSFMGPSPGVNMA